MQPNSLALITALIAGFPRRAKANDIIYQTGFESPAFNSSLPLHGQDGFSFVQLSRRHWNLTSIRTRQQLAERFRLRLTYCYQVAH
jgi:hypothetical protein